MRKRVLVTVLFVLVAVIIGLLIGLYTSAELRDYLTLGAGTIACYAEPGQRWTFYEIDPAVVRIARDARYFTFLGDCPAESLNVAVGDARLREERGGRT